MNKLIRALQTYLLVAAPFVVACMLAGTIAPHWRSGLAWELLSWNLMLWFLLLIVFLVLLVAIPAARERTLLRLANLRERDEREEFITGRAARATYMSTLSLMIFFLFFSVFTFDVKRKPPAQVVDGKEHVMSIGLRFDLWDESRKTAGAEDGVLFESRDLPLSKSAIILIFLAWQLASFNLAARRQRLG